ncbi:MAG: amidase [Acidisphaera sp.]|nr:amidase [Acidisphaera sp.]
MLSEADYLSHDMVGLAALVRSKAVTAAELLEMAVARAERINPAINAIIAPMYEQARAQAKRINGTEPLAGVPFLLKDLRASYRGVRTVGGSAFMAGVPDFDSEVTLRYINAGLLIMGKTNVPELGLSIDTQNAVFGATRNPWDTERSAGGSSGGSAAAVAARIVPAAHATDGAGSTRVPSSNCGLFGLKTSRGRITYGPDVGEELIGASTQHACTLSVRDSAALLDIACVPDYGDPYWAPPGPASYLDTLDRPPERLRIALALHAPGGVPVHPDCVEATRKTAALCESLGHVVSEAVPDVGWDEGFAKTSITLLGVGMHANVSAKAAALGRPIAEADFSPAVWEFLRVGKATTSAEYYLTVRKLHGLSRQLAKFHETYDVLLTPSLTVPPPLLSEFDYGAAGAGRFLEQFYAIAAFMPLANGSGAPAMTVPLWTNAAGLPIGSQFMARYGAEELLLRLAAQLEQASPWFDRRPALAAPA